MPLKPLRIIAVGRTRSPFWKSAAEFYIERLRRWRNVTEAFVRDGDPALSIVDRIAFEGKGILSIIEAVDIPIILDEHGKQMTSKDFSSFFERISDNANYRPCFVVGGAFGLDAAVKKVARYSIALGPMTLPHELARVLLLEQLYRAETISRKIPYHHE